MEGQMSATLCFPESVKQSGPSTRLVYAALEAHGPATLDEITSRTGVAQRTTKKALATLRKQGLAVAEPHPTDGRRRLYRTEAVHSDA